MDPADVLGPRYRDLSADVHATVPQLANTRRLL